MLAPFVIFCADPLSPRSVDPAFGAELEAARAVGFATAHLDHDELDHHVDADAALRKTRFQTKGSTKQLSWRKGRKDPMGSG
jgi:hypothetical protein